MGIAGNPCQQLPFQLRCLRGRAAFRPGDDKPRHHRRRRNRHALQRGACEQSAMMMHKIQRGFSLVSAIFLLVVIAALGTFAVTLSTTQQQSAALDVMGARAYQAARVGIEWGAYQVLPASAAAFATACRPGPTTQTVTPLPNTLAGFTVNVGCSATSH